MTHNPVREFSDTFSLDALRRAHLEPLGPQPSTAAIDSEEQAWDVHVSRRLLGDAMPVEAMPSQSPQPPPAVSASARMGLRASIAGLAGAIATMLVMAFASGPTTATPEPTPLPAATLAMSEVEPHPVEGDLELAAPMVRPTHARVTIPDVPAQPSSPPTLQDDGPVPSEESVTEPASSKTRTSGKRAVAKPRPAPKPTAKPTASTRRPSNTASRSPGSLSADCILDPARCGMESEWSASSPPASKSSASLPNKLSSTAIRRGLQTVKANARVCGDIHAAPAGTKVTVKLSLRGSSGKVHSATPQAPHNDALGRCVAASLSKASFDRFAAPSMGVLYSVRM